MHWAKERSNFQEFVIGLNEQPAFTGGSFACKFMLLCIHNYVQSRSAVLINMYYIFTV